MPAYEITLLIRRPLRVKVETEKDKSPVVFDNHGFAHIKVEGKEGMIVPAADLISVDMIVEKSSIVSPDEAVTGGGPRIVS